MIFLTQRSSISSLWAWKELAVPELGVLGFVFPFLEENGRFVVARHHQLQDTRLAPLCPFENFIYQQAAYAMLTVCRGRPHGNKMRSRWIVLVEERGSNAARNFAVQRHKSGPSLTVHLFYPCQPLGVGKLRPSCESGTEYMRGILQCAKANCFENKSV